MSTAAKVLIGITTLLVLLCELFFICLLGPELIKTGIGDNQSVAEIVQWFFFDYPFLAWALAVALVAHVVLLFFHLAHVSKPGRVAGSVRGPWIISFLVGGPVAFIVYFFKVIATDTRKVPDLDM